jgi:hypothetical protein
MRMLSAWSQQNSPITGIKVRGVLVARDQNGTMIMPAPVDYVSWTPRIAGFATDPQLRALHKRVLWTTGKMTPLARQQLVANGWTIASVKLGRCLRIPGSEATRLIELGFTPALPERERR